jgi:hypothetical protein
MAGLDDIFGPTPMGPRPTHPDFAQLVDLILQQDGKTEDPNFDMDAHLASIVDPESVSYIALQRAFRMVSLMGMNPIERPEVAVKLASLWIDAFCIGYGLAARTSG